MANLPPDFDTQFFDSGEPAAGYKLYTYETGTTTPKTTFSDQAGAVPNTNPITLDAEGRCSLWLGAGEYTLSLYNRLITDGGALIKTWSDIAGVASPADLDSLLSDLSSSVDDAKGAALVGYSDTLNYPSGSVGAALRSVSGTFNILNSIPTAEWAAIFDGTTNYDILTAFNTAKVNHRAIFFPADATFKTSGPLVMDREGLALLGGSTATTIIQQLPAFVGAATINVDGARLQHIGTMHVRGNNAGGSDAIRVTNGPLLSIEDVMVKVGTAGIRLISGNNQRWTNVFSESNATNFLVIPDVGDNTNGCTMTGLRSFNATSWGVDIQAGAGPSGHMHSEWDVSAEGGANGIRVRGGRYCQFSLYSEANSGDEFDLDPAAAHSYFLKNPDADADGALSNIASFSMGTNGQGANLYFDRGIAPERHAEQAFAVSGSLAQVGVTMWDVTNISGSTRGITLSFLSYLPVGFKAMITKRDNTPGFTLTAPGGITLTGDTGTWGASVTTVAVLWVEKINSTTAICIQR